MLLTVCKAVKLCILWSHDTFFGLLASEQRSPGGSTYPAFRPMCTTIDTYLHTSLGWPDMTENFAGRSSTLDSIWEMPVIVAGSLLACAPNVSLTALQGPSCF